MIRLSPCIPHPAHTLPTLARRWPKACSPCQRQRLPSLWTTPNRTCSIALAIAPAAAPDSASDWIDGFLCGIMGVFALETVLGLLCRCGAALCCAAARMHLQGMRRGAFEGARHPSSLSLHCTCGLHIQAPRLRTAPLGSIRREELPLLELVLDVLSNASILWGITWFTDAVRLCWQWTHAWPPQLLAQLLALPCTKTAKANGAAS